MKLLLNPVTLTIATFWIAAFGWFLLQLLRAPVLAEDQQSDRPERQ